MNSTAASTDAAPARRWRAIVPAARWLGGYERRWLGADMVAGFTLAAYLLPAALGDASLAGLPPQAGLYACMFSGLVFWLFCSSSQTAISVTSAISMLIGASLGTISDGDPSRYAALAACTALLTGVIGLIAWLVRAGSAVSYISETVMTGFKAGVALHLASTQLPKLFGVTGGHGDFWERMGVFLHHLPETNRTSLLLGVSALLLLILGKKLLPNRPVALLVVVGGIVTASLFDVGSKGVKLLGQVPSGIPTPGLPRVYYQDVGDLLPLALACFLLGAVETAAIGRMLGKKHGKRLDSNQEFLALAGANLASGLGHGFPVSGGMSQSLVNDNAGARTPLSGLIASAIILLVAIFCTGLLQNLPQPVLAAVVLIAIAGLVQASELVWLWKHHRGEFLVAAGALAGVLWAGLLRGVLLGMVISLVLLIRRTSTPHVAFLGRIPGTRRYSDLARHDDNESVPGVLAFRVEAGIVYFNIDHIFDTVLARIDAMTAPPRIAVFDLSTSPNVDIAGAHMIKDLQEELAHRGIEFRLAEAHAAVRDMLRVEGVDEKFGGIDRFTSLTDAIDSSLAELADKASPVTAQMTGAR